MISLMASPLMNFTQIIRSCFGSPALPYLTDDLRRKRVIKYAFENGIADRLKSAINPTSPVLASPRSAYREYDRSGNRQIADAIFMERMRLISDVALGCYIGFDYKDYLQDLIWAECETTWWVMTAHQGCEPLDLWSTSKALTLSNILVMLDAYLDDEVKQRTRHEIQRRILDPYLSPDTGDLGWRKCTNNWNAVCHAGVGIASMHLEKDVDKLAATMRQIILDLPNFIDGFTDDGGCTEGPSYWDYGFGWYLKLAEAMYHFTAGKINIMQGEKIRRICEYPFAVNINDGTYLTFADASSIYIPVATASRINLFTELPEIYSLCQFDNGKLYMDSIDDLLLYDGRDAAPVNDEKNYYLPSLAIAKFKTDDITLGAKAGDNDEHHNHNDIGTFIYNSANINFITDLGHPIYTARTFSPHRYESIFTNSFGHNVPVINGEMQKAGKEYRGTMTISETEGVEKVIEIDMTAAYGIKTLNKFNRKLRLTNYGILYITDYFVFDDYPTSLEEGFITEQYPVVTDHGTVMILSPHASVELSALCPGNFFVTELTDAKKENPRNTDIFRISFIPFELYKTIECNFVVFPA